MKTENVIAPAHRVANLDLSTCTAAARQSNLLHWSGRDAQKALQSMAMLGRGMGENEVIASVDVSETLLEDVYSLIVSLLDRYRPIKAVEKSPKTAKGKGRQRSAKGGARAR